MYLQSTFWVFTENGKYVRTYKKGDSLDGVPKEEIDRLVYLGAASENIIEEENKDPLMVFETPKPKKEEEPKDKMEFTIPPKTASINKWKDLAKKLDLNIAGMKKPEIIALVYKYVNSKK